MNIIYAVTGLHNFIISYRKTSEDGGEAHTQRENEAIARAAQHVDIEGGRRGALAIRNAVAAKL